MKEKITYLLKSQNLSTTRFAEILGIQPSAVSHLVSGRNKPGYDLLQKILRRFPNINPDWLLLDSDQPYRHDVSDESSDQSSIFSDDEESTPIDDSTAPPSDTTDVMGILTRGKSGRRDQPKGSKSPIFVVVFYDDGTCENFSMQ